MGEPNFLWDEFEFSGFTDAAKDPKEEAMLSSSAETEEKSDEDPKHAYLESLPLASSFCQFNH